MTRTRRSRGFTLIEAVLMIVLLAILALGVGTALSALAAAPRAVDKDMATANALSDKLEALRALDFDALASSTGPDSLGRTWTVSTVQSNLKQVTVTLNGRALTTYVAQP